MFDKDLKQISRIVSQAYLKHKNL